jgi:ABC-2 type transport system permease protein
MLRGLWKLTWLEIKIFMREPLGLVGTIGMPVLVFVVLGRFVSVGRRPFGAATGELTTVVLPVFGALLIAVGAVQSLVTIVAIYRESGILKRLRATPLRPQTILAAQVLVKLMLTGITMVAMLAAGRRLLLPPGVGIPVVGFAVALLLSTLSILSVGFIIASLVPTARFAQPVASLIFYPMMALALVPAQSMPWWLWAVSRLMPLTYAVSLLRGIAAREGWLAHAGDLVALAVIFAVCTATSAKVFRWE